MFFFFFWGGGSKCKVTVTGSLLGMSHKSLKCQLWKRQLQLTDWEKEGNPKGHIISSDSHTFILGFSLISTSTHPALFSCILIFSPLFISY